MTFKMLLDRRIGCVWRAAFNDDFPIGKDDRGGYGHTPYAGSAAESGAIARKEASARKDALRQAQRENEAKIAYAANVEQAARNLKIQRARDAAAEKAGWEARRLAEQAEQIEHIRALNAGVFGAGEAGRQRNA